MIQTLPSPRAIFLNVNTQIPLDIDILHRGQMSPRTDAVPVTREELSLQCSAHEYQTLLQNGHLRSEDLVNRCLDQIDRHNNLGLKLNAVLSVCPRDLAISRAKALDEERRQGKLRGELHGIPVIIKVRKTAIKGRNLETFAERTRTVLSRDLPWGW